MYGTPQFNTAQQYIGYLGLFRGDAIQFRQTPPDEKARRLVRLMGGREKVLREAFSSYKSGDAQWAAELATYLIRINNEDKNARILKAAAFRKLGYAEVNPQWRHWYLMAALELEGKLDLEGLSHAIAQQLGGETVPADSILDNLRYKVDPKKAGQLHLRINVLVSDKDQRFHLELRNSVLKVRRGHGEIADVHVSLEHSELAALATGKMPFAASVENNAVAISGDKGTAKRFFDSLDLEIRPVHLTVR
jgi:alkyl sulfatase BDS1-like metallo-beta-lactamase superfamily hydrolase